MNKRHKMHTVMKGYLDGTCVGALLQTIGGLDNPMAIAFRGADRNAIVYLHQGKVIWAQSDEDRRGVEALASILVGDWERFVVFRADFGPQTPAPLGELRWLLLCNAAAANDQEVEDLRMAA